MKLEVGKYYKMRDGRKIGPMRKFDQDSFDSALHVNDDELGGLWQEDGLRYYKAKRGGTDIVSLWDDSGSVSAISLLGSARSHMETRAAIYDSPEGERSMAQTVAVFNQFHGTTLTEAQGWHFMQILKDVRFFSHKGYHADSAEDCVAYSALKAEAKAKEVSS